MLNLWGKAFRGADGVTRRGFLKVGALGFGGLSLPNLLRATENRRTAKAVILFWMAGGPSHIDTYDMKPSAAREVAGPFRPIRTRVPGLDVCELLPRHADLAQKFSIIRSLRHEHAVHDDASHWVQTGYPLLSARERGQSHPAQGSVVSHLLGANHPEMPAYVCVPEAYSSRLGFYQQSATLGARHNPVAGGGNPALGPYRMPDFTLPANLTIDRLHERRHLAQRFDALSGLRDAPGFQSMDDSQRRAFDLVTGARARAAFDVQQEPASLRDRYGRHAWGEAAILSRRLIEAGVTFVTINLYEKDLDWWDDHTVIEQGLSRRLPRYDQALCSLIEDLHERGLGEDVLVAAFGEFGRSPRVDAGAGRGHWPKAMSALLSGGGIRGGQVIGATDAIGSEPRDRPLGPGDLLATIYRTLGVDADRMIADRQNRPHRLVEAGQAIGELF